MAAQNGTSGTEPEGPNGRGPVGTGPDETPDDNAREVESAATEATESVAEAASDAASAVRGAPEEEPQPIHPHPAYEDYEAPDSNIVPKVIAAILGGVVVGWLILRRRGRD